MIKYTPEMYAFAADLYGKGNSQKEVAVYMKKQFKKNFRQNDVSYILKNPPGGIVADWSGQNYDQATTDMEKFTIFSSIMKSKLPAETKYNLAFALVK